MKPGDFPSVESKAMHPVSANNPCPFLRALVADGYLADQVERLATIADMIVEVSGETPAALPRSPVYLIALIANGLGPMQLMRNLREGAKLANLRDGPLDKRGAGSRILDRNGGIDGTELARLDQFASDKTDTTGITERGLDAAELRMMMDANFARAAGRRRRIDRTLMIGEWPVLLRVMGKASAQGAYLSLTEVSTLFTDRRLPRRITGRLQSR